MDALELPSSIGPVLFEEPFKSLLPKLMALHPDDVLHVNLSIPAAVMTALGVQPTLLAMKERIAETLPRADRDLPGELATYALALSHAHALYVTATRASDPVPLLAEEGMKLRSLLLSDSKALINRGFVDKRTLRSYKGSVGYQNLAFDLQLLVQVFRSCPPVARERSAARMEELQRAEEIAAIILAMLRKRAMPDRQVGAAADMRNRAFTLFTWTYDQLRRAVVFLRWNEGDADQLVPSLYAKHKQPRKKVDAAESREQPAQVIAIHR